MPLSEMLLQGLAQSGDIGAFQERADKRQMQELNLLEKRRQLEDQQRLRELYMSGRQPSMQEIMSVSPTLGIEMQKAQIQNMMQMQQMEKLQREQQESQAKTYAQYVGPIADQYFIDIEGGMKPEMAIQKYHSAFGAAQAELEKKHGISPQIDFRTVTPEQVLQRSVGLGQPSRYYQMREESYKRQLPPQMSAEQAYGGVEMTPYGPMRKPALRETGGFTKATAEDLPMLQQAYDQATDLNEKQKIGALLNQLQKQTGAGLSQSQFVTPEQIPALKAEEAGAKKQAELAAQGEHEAEQQLSVLKALDEQNVESLIDKSFHSRPEAMAKGEYGLSGIAGASTEANTAYKELVVIEAQMRDLAKAIVGAGPISEGEQKIIKDALGGVSNPSDAASRKAAYRKFVDLAKRKISRYPHLSQQMKAIEDMSGKEASQNVGARLQVGHEENGYVYKGGDPGVKSSWEKK